MGSCTVTAHEGGSPSDHRIDGKFVNTDPASRYRVDASAIFSALWKLITEKSDEARPKEHQIIPVVRQSRASLEALPDYSVIRLLHSTLLFKMENRFWLTDPVFSDDISPTMLFRNKRFHELPLSIEELPEIEGVILSHNHYDHLDEASITALKEKAKVFYVPLGLADALAEFGVAKEKIVELDWWESVRHGGFELTATPAQHFSGRGVFDGGETLWCSWVVRAPKAGIFFSGDSGYFDGFKRIGEAYGPFDMTFMEAGAYHEDWKTMHLMPEESVRAHIDLNGSVMFPIHNGSFDLAMHSWYEPFDAVVSAAEAAAVRVAHPKMGEAVPILEYVRTDAWWRSDRVP